MGFATFIQCRRDATLKKGIQANQQGCPQPHWTESSRRAITGRSNVTISEELSMSARDFINDTLLPWLEQELADQPTGNKHYLHGFDDALKGVAHFLEAHRDQWDAAG